MIWEKIIKNVQEIALQKKENNSKTIIAIDGVDASGKTYFAKQFKEKLEEIHLKAFVISIDNFHHQQRIRYQKGNLSSIGFYQDSYNYAVFVEETIMPIKIGSNTVKIKEFDLEKDVKCELFEKIEPYDIIIVEGIFLHRTELYSFWDFSIFLDVPLEQSLLRYVKRTMENQKFLDEETLLKNYRQRYVSGQEIYLNEANPKGKANIIIDNSDYKNPQIINL